MRSIYVNSIRGLLCALLLCLHLSCQKDKITKEQDQFIEETEQFSELKAETLAAGNEFIEVGWNKIFNTHFKTVSYTIYLNDKKIVEGLSTTKYSLINLEPGQEYAIKIVAATAEGKQTEQVLKASTFPVKTPEATQIIRKEYKIHSYSDLTGPIAMRRFSGGGHLIVTYLRHPATLSDGIYKLIIFRTDEGGNIMWYRLLPTLPQHLDELPPISLVLHAQEKEGIAFLNSYALKIGVSDGEILLEKDFRSINELSVQSAVYASSQQLFIGTRRGSLLSLNPGDLSVQWHRTNDPDLGAIAGIRLDSKRNIFVILRSFTDQRGILIHKYNPQGEYLSEIKSEGGDAGTVSFLIDADDNFHAFSYTSYSRFLHYSKLDPQGVLIKSTTIPDAIASPGPFINHKNEIAVQGRYDGSGLTTYGGIFVFDEAMNVKSKRFFTEIPYHMFRGLTVNPDGSYNILLNYMQTYTYTNRNLVFIKTDANGKI